MDGIDIVAGYIPELIVTENQSPYLVQIGGLGPGRQADSFAVEYQVLDGHIQSTGRPSGEGNTAGQNGCMILRALHCNVC